MAWRFASRDDRLRPTLRNRFMTVFCIVGAVAADARDPLLGGNLVEQALVQSMESGRTDRGLAPADHPAKTAVQISDGVCP